VCDIVVKRSLFIFVLVFVSHDFELGSNVSCEERVDPQCRTGLIFCFILSCSIFCYGCMFAFVVFVSVFSIKPRDWLG